MLNSLSNDFSLCKNNAKYVIITGCVIFVYCDVACFVFFKSL